MGKPAVMEAAIAKLYLSECFVQSSQDAIRIHGGYGYMTEYEKWTRLSATLSVGRSTLARPIFQRVVMTR